MRQLGWIHYRSVNLRLIMQGALFALLMLVSAVVSPVQGADDLAPTGDSQILPADAKLELLWDEGVFTEGVAVAPDGQVYFSDIQSDPTKPGRILHFDPTTKKTVVYSANSGQSNGLFFDAEGRLLACCGANGGLRALCRILPDGKPQPIAERIEGKRFNAPNDLCVHPNGDIYFSDPHYIGSEPRELDHMSVYLVRKGEVRRVTTEITKPNGVILAPDGKTLYVAETNNGGPPPAAPWKMTLNAFRIQADGSLTDRRVLVDFGKDAGVDGMTVDTAGRIYAAVRNESRHGIHVFSPEGQELARIPTKPLPTNCAFGVGREAQVLYVTAGTGLYRITLKTTGYHPELVKP